MSILGSIFSAIFHHAKAATPAAQTPDAQTNPAAPVPAATPVATPATIDIDSVLTDMAAHNSQTLNWKQSIVDLLKLLGLDSSLDARKKLAAELGYTGSTDDSAAMNVWLIGQVRQKLAENGGKVPAGL
ncbi:DUF3597 domain-containing protein [Acetobacter vaccinii]|uniref:DUF3597 domain-containing protein n=1 Tax=Acetobacter vaccinii TaxID=2592655 RepID=A0A5C1YP46_9PROT|nr:DUF3597 domain-containing protein [Acetobacter vaccinii]QEO16562.1 DUF3597 domain-containing protein [Acetobacter vaccinii]